MEIFFRILYESLSGAFRELRTNKLRTFLTLLGICIGIFCIISIFSSVDSLKVNLETGINKLGNNVIYVNKFPWGPEEGETEYPWWRYWNRPYATYDEMKELQDNLPSADAIAISIWTNGYIVKYNSKTVSDATINGVSYDFSQIMSLDFSSGRYFTALENNSGEPKVIVGSDVAAKLFPANVDPVGLQIEFMGDHLTVIGVFKKEGKSLVNTSNDNLIMVPYHYLTKRVEIDGFQVEPTLMVEGKPGVSIDEMKQELRGAMRGIRRIPPKQSDNFAMNTISIISSQLSSVFGVMDVVALFIGGFAILVGGFGIANIMFVTVRERTNIIGIKKALGAKNYFILLEFLIEAIILAIIGGIVGLLLVIVVLKGISSAAGFNFVVNSSNIFLGLVISSVIGLIAGLIPAIIAARLDPVKAIRFK